MEEPVDGFCIEPITPWWRLQLQESVSDEVLTNQSAQPGFHAHLQGKQEEAEIPLAYSTEERKDGLQYLAGG